MALNTDPSCLLLRNTLHVLKRPIMIGIAGDSGSGKTLFSNGIRKMLGHEIVQTIEMDGYHTETRSQREISGILPLDPSANKFDLLVQHLQSLKEGKSIEIPRYDHVTGTFRSPVRLSPTPIIILEGLHALYPEFLPFLDFTIYTDPERKVKKQWKTERDIKKRGHAVTKLTEEMFRREAAYKRWIDFQKTCADVVIKIFHTHIQEFARYELINPLPPTCYKVELIMKTTSMPMPSVHIPFDLAAFVNPTRPPFMLSAAPCRYWGRDIMDIHIDGMIPQHTIDALEKHILACTGIPALDALTPPLDMYTENGQHVTSIQFCQLIVAWRFLEQINNTLRERELLPS